MVIIIVELNENVDFLLAALGQNKGTRVETTYLNRGNLLLTGIMLFELNRSSCAVKRRRDEEMFDAGIF